MFSFSSKLSEFNTTKEPFDLIPSSILEDQPRQLFLNRVTAEMVDHQFNSVIVVVKPFKASRGANVWDVDLNAANPGYIDHDGNFIFEKSKKIVNVWFILEDEKTLGPLDDQEVREYTPTSKTLIKREFDRGFVTYSSLVAEFPDLQFKLKELNKFFSKNHIKEEKTNEDDFFDESILNEKNSRLRNFIRNHNVGASIDFIVKTITNKRRNTAVDLLYNITGLERSINAALVDLIVETAGKQILSDVDKDGFCIKDTRTRTLRK